MGRLRQLLLRMEWIRHVRPESFGALVKVQHRQVCRGHFFYSGFFLGRDFGLELIGDRLRNLALDSKNICQTTVIFFRPKMRVRPGVDQLRGYAHLVAGALYAAFEYMRNAELLGDLAQVAIYGVSVLHHAGTTDYLQVSNFGEVRKDFVLNAVCEISVLFLIAEILKRKNGHALFGNGNRHRSEERRV